MNYERELIKLGRDSYSAVQGWYPEDFEEQEGKFTIERAIKAIEIEIELGRGFFKDIARYKLELEQVKRERVDLMGEVLRLHSNVDAERTRAEKAEKTVKWASEHGTFVERIDNNTVTDKMDLTSEEILKKAEGK